MKPEVKALLQMLGSRPIAYHRILANVAGGAVPALFLSQLLYWTGLGKQGDWVWKSRAEMEAETGLTRSEQATARRKLKNAGIIDEKLAGVPATIHYRVNVERLLELVQFAGNAQTGLQETCKLDGAKPANYPETTQENTTSDARELFGMLAGVCKIDLDLITQRQRGMLNQTIKILRERGITLAEIEAFGAWWYANDWRGKTGQPPTPAQVRETWGQFAANGGGKPTTIKVGR